ncbi:Hypothetical predicted protein [Lecanosticta acicola]|uniref:Uncharacterized protein n=1 Tax=Lecanosticta acicola TaxID=111012 RepID=A0AAI8Z3D9_9PEZI|nr:Hypothetical predicted protein [Lecanosticta acicola]
MSSPTASFGSDLPTSVHASPDLHGNGSSSPATSVEIAPEEQQSDEERARQNQAKQRGNKTQEEQENQQQQQGEQQEEVPRRVVEVLETYTKLAEGQPLPTRQEGGSEDAHDLEWTLTPNQYQHLRRIIASRDSRWIAAARWAPDKAREEYCPQKQLLRLRMCEPIHGETAHLAALAILDALKKRLKQDPSLLQYRNTFFVGSNSTIELKEGDERYPQVPDASIKISGTWLPPFVIEVKFSNPLPDSKAENYIYGSEADIRTVLYLNIDYRSPKERKTNCDPYKMTISLFRLEPESADPTCMYPTPFLHNVPIPSTLELEQDPTLRNQDLTLRLGDFHPELDFKDTFTVPFSEIRALLDHAIEIQRQKDEGNNKRSKEAPRIKLGDRKRTREEAQPDSDEGRTPTTSSDTGEEDDTEYKPSTAKRVKRDTQLPARESRRRSKATESSSCGEGES